MLKLGTDTVNIPFAKAYLGSDLVYEKNVEPPYTELSYIEATGTQWIDTLITFNYNLCLEIQFSLTTTSHTADMHLCSASTSVNGTTYRFYPIAKNQSQSTFRCARYDNSVVFSTTANTSIHTLLYGQRTSSTATPRVLWDNTNKGSLYSYTITSTNTLPIFCVKGPTGNTANYSLARLYYMKLYDNVTNELYRDFIPVMDSNNVVCLYDKVSQTFFYNQGTGDFLGGNVVLTSNASNNALLMNTGSLVGGGSRAELTTLATSLDNEQGKEKESGDTI